MKIRKISQLTIYTGLLEMLVELFNAVNLNQSCDRMSSCTFTSTKLVANLLSNQNSVYTTAVPLSASYDRYNMLERIVLRAR